MITRTGKQTAIDRRLADVPADKVFWANDGRIIKNMVELGEALNAMSDDVFKYHSNEAKTDFSHWVGEVIGDDSLARRLQKASNREEAARAVSERIAQLRPKASR